MLKRILVAAAGAVFLAGGCLQTDPVATNMARPTRFKEAESLYLAKNFAAAKARFLTVAASEAAPERAFAKEARYYAARCDQCMGNYEAAVRVYNRLLEVPPYRSLEIRTLVSRGDISMEATGPSGVPDYVGAVHDYGRARRLLGQGGQIDDIDHGRLTYRLGLAYYGLAVSASSTAEREARYRDADACFDEYMRDYPQGRFFEEAKRHHSAITGRAPVTAFYVVVEGSSTVKDQAESIAKRARAKGYSAQVVSEKQAGTTIYRVRVGACETSREAYALKRQLEAAGFSSAEVRP